MAKIDPAFTAKMQDWLNTPKAERDIPAGALMLLQLNGNRIFYNTVILRPQKFADKLEYEMRKFLRMRIANMAVADVVKMEAKVMPQAKETVAHPPVISVDDELPGAKVAKGRRADHDQLPRRIQALWDGNFDLHKRIVMLYNECCAMQDANAQPCDIYETLQMLADADKKYRSNLEQYDSYVPTGEPDEDEDEEDAEPVWLTDPEEIARRVSNVRKNLSKVRRTAVKGVTPESKAKALRKVQQYVDELQHYGADFSPDTIQALTGLGIKFQ